MTKTGSTNRETGRLLRSVVGYSLIIAGAPLMPAAGFFMDIGETTQNKRLETFGMLLGLPIFFGSVLLP